MSDGARRKNKLNDGYSDGFKPLEPLDLSKVKTVNDLVRQMGNTAFGGRCLGEAAEILHKMATDKDCFVVLTLSGAMTVAKMSLVICDLIDHGIVDAVVSTGALVAHGLVEAAGLAHFKYEPGMNDRELYYKGYDRVYDTLELEQNLDDAEIIISKILEGIEGGTIISSQSINEMLGKYLAENTKGRGILKSAYQKKVPVYIPAFTDSELGLDIAIHNRRCEIKKKAPFQFDPYKDLNHYTDLLKTQERLGIFTVGGGVPRNWAQQVGPYLDLISKRISNTGLLQRFRYAVRICPEPAHWGGLSGCTYSEGVSWGKFVPKSEGGMWAEVPADATIALPLIVKAVLERL